MIPNAQEIVSQSSNPISIEPNFSNVLKTISADSTFSGVQRNAQVSFASDFNEQINGSATQGHIETSRHEKSP